jgi:eukaryotic-like serine/threonine-protein kinase
MPLSAGTKLGPYEIVSPVGAGGMGEVYRARDPRLDRTVAIKILPARLSNSAEARQRFDREARAISSLSHPNICHLYDIGQQDGTSYLVMEYLEGETLADRLRKGPLPLEQVLKIGAEVCEGLGKAHRSGVVHRDLKPSNIMLTRSGAKLMDFGLAKAPVAAVAAGSSSDSLATMSRPLTAEGTIVGTFQYMSPEQVEGKDADPRSDIFSLGAVLYEMVTGKRAFEGKTTASTIAAILAAEPKPISGIQPMAPFVLERVVKKCLAKDPDERWQSASDLASELNWIEGAPEVSSQKSVSYSKLRRERVLWLTAVFLAIAAAVAVLVSRPSQSRFSERARWIITAPEGSFFHLSGENAGPVVVSPDGRQLAFVAVDANGKTQLWVRNLDSLTSEVLPGTEGASFPFWAPDSRSLGFFSHNQLKRIEAAGGPALTLCDVKAARGGSWGLDGTILFTPDTLSAVYRIPQSGGRPVAATRVDVSQHDSHRWPYFLPDGKHFLYFAASHSDLSHSRDSLYVGSLDGKLNKLLMHTHANAAYMAGHLLFLRDATLMAQPFDLLRLELTGEPIVVQEGVQNATGWWLGVFSASQNGVLAFAPSRGAEDELVWLNRIGKQVGTTGEPGQYVSLRMSPNEQQVVIEYDGPQHDLWIHDFARNVGFRFTFGPVANAGPVWSPDGKQIAFASQRGDHVNVYVKPVSGEQAETPLLESDIPKIPLDWSHDGNFLLYAAYVANGEEELWVLPTRGAHDPRLLLKPPFYNGDGRFSPDSRWIVYNSRDQGTEEVFVMPFPGPGPRIRISPRGGSSPRWRSDANAILFLDDAMRLEETEVHHNGSELTVGKTQQLFPLSLEAPVWEGSAFEIAKDGRILGIRATGENTSEIVVHTNWSEGLASLR